jgi:hypothetical protein
MENDMNSNLSLKEFLDIYKNQIHRIPLKILNRRRVKLYQLLNDNDEKFSESNIKISDPLLYDFFVGYRDKNILYNSKKVNSLSNFLLRELERDEYTLKLKEEIEKQEREYGKDKIDIEIEKVNKINSQCNNSREDDIDTLLRLCMHKFIYNPNKTEYDDDSDLDLDDKENENYEEENYFNS